MLIRIVFFPVLILQFYTLVNLCHADTEVEFPEDSVGSLYCAPPEKVRFGAEAHLAQHVPEWGILAAAAGKVQLPDGMLIRLSMHTAPNDSKLVKDTSWVNNFPTHAIHSLLINIPLNDRQFSRFANWTGLQELVLRDCEVTSAIASDLAKLTQLKSLNLARLPAIDDELMATVAEFPNLQEFTLRRAKVTDSGMALLSRSRSLTCVVVDGVAITDEGIASLVKLTNLLALNVYAEESDEGENASIRRSQTKVTDVGLAHIGRCTQLESLNIHGAKVSLAGLQSLFERCTKLRYLALSRRAVDVGALGAASTLAHLETIRITGTVLNDQDARHLSQLRNLRRVVGNLQIGNEGVEQIAALQHLEYLHFSGEANDECMQFLARLRNLQELSVQGTQVTDEGLALLKGSSRLERVQLNGQGFTSRCLQTAVNWPNLNRLSLWHLVPRKDGKLEWSEMSTLPAKLQSLDFAFCPEIGDDQLKFMSSLANLESLSIRTEGLKGITDIGAGHLAQARRLKSLTIRPSSITDQGLSSLQAMESLENLDITSMTTSTGLESLGQRKLLKSLAISSPDLSIKDAEGFQTRHPHILQFQFHECDFSRAESDVKQDLILRCGSLSNRAKLNALEGKVPPALNATAWTPMHGDVKLEKLRGNVVLLDFWGTWCGACLKELPRIRELHAKYREKGLVVITIHSTEGADNMASFLSKTPFPWPNGCDVNDQTASALAVDRWPSTYLIDKQGKLRFANPLNDQLEEAVKLLIED